MNRRIRQLAVGLMLSYVVLFAALNYWQVGQKPELDARFDNTRQVLREFNKPRGQIISADGVVVARSLPDTRNDDLDFVRDYPAGDLFANVTGYFTKDFGSTAIENTHADVLTGSTTEQQFRGLGNLLDGNVDNTGSVQLTLRHDAQAAAKALLGERRGSITVVEPATGKVVAMYSNPTYDPNSFVGADFDDARDTITELQNAEGNPLLAHAFQERYMPGSTFKVITTGVGLTTGVLTVDSEFPRERQFVPPQTDDPINNYNGTQCGGPLVEVFRRSCNIAFARTALDLGVGAFVSGTGDWGVGEPVPIDLPGAAASTLGDVDDLQRELPLLAIRGFGQSEVQMVPLHMAMVAATVANGGRMMAPYVVDATFDNAGAVLDRTRPTEWNRPVSAGDAGIMRDFMIEVVETGTASCCLDLANGVQAAAKTGTAELGLVDDPDRSHAWIVAFAPAEAPRYAISVVLTDVQSTNDVAATGGRLAGPIAADMLDLLLAS